MHSASRIGKQQWPPMIVARYCRVNWNRLRRLPTVKVIQRTAIIVATAIRLRRCQPRKSLTYAQATPIGASAIVAPQHRHSTGTVSDSQVTSDSDTDSAIRVRVLSRINGCGKFMPYTTRKVRYSPYATPLAALSIS